MSQVPDKAVAAAPSAPPLDAGCAAFPQRPPPPSYEESMRMSASAQQMRAASATMPQYMPQQQQQTFMTTNTPFPGAYPRQEQLPVYYPNQFATSMPTQSASLPSGQYGQSNHKAVPQVLMLDSFAKINTTKNGTINVPPPPPGYAPTAAQHAAMMGQPIIVQKNKRGFF